MRWSSEGLLTAVTVSEMARAREILISKDPLLDRVAFNPTRAKIDKGEPIFEVEPFAVKDVSRFDVAVDDSEGVDKL